MREILFRGKRKDNGEWFYGNLVYMTEGYDKPQAVISPSTTYISNGDIWGDFWFVDPETVGQWTGLVDKNGVKIFEGDICSWKFTNEYGELYKVSIRNGCSGFEPVHYDLAHPDDRKWKCFWDNEDDEIHFVQYWDVIGNIHDNPELLEESK